MGRSPINSSEVKKGPWSPEEDRKLREYIEKNGQGKWQLLPERAGLNRCGKSCRLRWTNYLRPDIKRGNFSAQEQQTIIDLHSSLGNKWSLIATHLPGRTDNEIKNHWNTHLRKKLLRSGIDPETHQPVTDHSSSLVDLINPLQNLAKIRLLGNILQLLYSNPLSSYLGGSEKGNQFDGILNPISTLPNMENVNLSSNYRQPDLDTFPGTVEHGNNSGPEYWLPELVDPASPEISSGSHVYSVDQSKQILNDDQFFISNNYHSWGTAADDEASCSFWKDIFDDSFLSSSF